MIRTDKKVYWNSIGPWKGWLWIKPKPRRWECIVWKRRDEYAFFGFTEEEHAEIEKKQAKRPCYLGYSRRTEKHYWHYRDEFFACDEKFKSDVILGFCERRSATKASRIEKYEALGKQVRGKKEEPAVPPDTKAADSALLALIKLGFKKSESSKAIVAAYKENPGATSDILVKNALMSLRPTR